MLQLNISSTSNRKRFFDLATDVLKAKYYLFSKAIINIAISWYPQWIASDYYKAQRKYLF